MIFDNIKNAKFYCGIDAKFEKAFNFINKAVDEDLPCGKYEIDGKELYASIMEHNGKNYDEAKSEGHRNYADIQFIVSGVEYFEAEDISVATVKSEYNPEKDVEFYYDPKNPIKAVLMPGDFAIFFPHDIHKPGMIYNGERTTVKKIVVKIKM